VLGCGPAFWRACKDVRELPCSIFDCSTCWKLASAGSPCQNVLQAHCRASRTWHLAYKTRTAARATRRGPGGPAAALAGPRGRAVGGRGAAVRRARVQHLHRAVIRRDLGQLLLPRPLRALVPAGLWQSELLGRATVARRRVPARGTVLGPAGGAARLRMLLFKSNPRAAVPRLLPLHCQSLYAQMLARDVCSGLGWQARRCTPLCACHKPLTHQQDSMCMSVHSALSMRS
jgi:hypothetical protein